jgi:hypothetical protein
MNEVPETTFEEIKLASKQGSCARIKPAERREIAQCAEGEQLKQLYDSTLQEWRKQSQPQVHPFLEGDASAARASQLREEALAKRNAAANRMYLHRASCAICRRRR